MEDRTLTWKDETGEYKIGYSQKLQTDIIKELQRSNKLKIVMAVILILILISMILIVSRNEMLTRLGQRIFCM